MLLLRLSFSCLVHRLIGLLLLFGEDTGEPLSEGLSCDSVAAQFNEPDHCDADDRKQEA